MYILHINHVLVKYWTYTYTIGKINKLLTAQSWVKYILYMYHMSIGLASYE